MTVFHVSKTGDDASDGLSAATAFRTLAAAQEAMRASDGADRTLVHEGTYRLATPLTLTADDTGSAFVAAPGEAVTLSGGRAVTGWQEGADGIWTARLNAADLHQLTLNGAQMTEARYPNEVPADPVRGGWLFAGNPPEGLDPLRQMVVRAGDRAAAEFAPGAEVHVYAGVSWANDVLTVESYDPATGIVTFAEEATYDLTAASRYFVQGTDVQLDSPGEWYFDRATKTVHFKAPPGFDGTGVVAAGDRSVIEVQGASHVRIEGFTISDAATDAYSSDIYTAGVLVRGSDHVSIVGNSFVNLAKGVRLDNFSHHVTVRANDFAHIWSSGIDLDYGSHHNRLTGNDIRWTGEVFVASAGINLAESFGNRIAGNLIRDVPRFGIGTVNYDPDHRSGGNVIAFNTILHSMQRTSDGGAIYVWSGPDRAHDGDMIRHNRIIDAGGVETEAGGFRPGNEYSNGIYLDDFTSRSTVLGNFIQGAVRGGIYLHGGSFNTVTGNITLDNADIGIQLFEIGEAMIGNLISGNIVGMVGAGDNAVEANPDFVAPGTLRSNWYLTANGLPVFEGLTLADWQALGFDAGSVLLDGSPFADAPGGDFSVTGLTGFADLPWDRMLAFRGGLIVAGTSGRDGLAGSAGADIMVGLDGDDFFLGGAGADQIEGGAGRDTVSYAGALAGVQAELAGVGADGDVLTGVENLTGSGFADRLTGDSGANVLRGGAGDDALYGGSGSDVMVGGTGADRMAGGAGADRFVFRPADSVADNADRIAGFESGSDTIDLRTMGDLVLVAALDGTAGQVVVSATGVAADLTGDGVADFVLRVGGVAAGDLLIL